MGKLSDLIKKLSKTNEEFKNTKSSDYIYDKKVIKILFESEPIEEDWDRFEDSRENPKDMLTPYGQFITDNMKFVHNLKTSKTKTEYLYLIANSLVTHSKNEDVKEWVEMIYQLCYVIEGGLNSDEEEKVYDLLDDYEEKAKDNPSGKPEENHNFLLDFQKLPTQIRYHRWAIVNKKKVLHTNYMRNRFINIVSERFFKNFLSNNIAESHAKMNTDFLHHMNLPSDKSLADTYRKWIGIFTKSVMLVYYGHYQWSKFKGDFFNKEGDRLPKGDRPNSKVFYRYFDVSEEEIRKWGNQYRKKFRSK